MQLMQQFKAFKQQIAGKDPKKMVENLIAQGQVSTDQVRQYANQAREFMAMFGK